MVEQRACSGETGVNVCSGNANVGALDEEVEPVFYLFAEVIREPMFAKEKFELARNQEQGGIARRNDDPNGITGREFEKLIYGDRSPYARTIEYKTLANISRDDVVGFYQKYFHPKNMILGISGDFDTAKMRSLVEQKFGNWQPTQNAEVPVLPTVSPTKSGGVFFGNQQQLSQSYVQRGNLDGMLNSPD